MLRKLSFYLSQLGQANACLVENNVNLFVKILLLILYLFFHSFFFGLGHFSNVLNPDQLRQLLERRRQTAKLFKFLVQSFILVNPEQFLKPFDSRQDYVNTRVCLHH